MNAPKGLTAVMLMLCVPTPGDPITARAKMDFLEMELTALVSTKHQSLFILALCVIVILKPFFF